MKESWCFELAVLVKQCLLELLVWPVPVAHTDLAQRHESEVDGDMGPA